MVAPSKTVPSYVVTEKIGKTHHFGVLRDGQIHAVAAMWEPLSGKIWLRLSDRDQSCPRTGLWASSVCVVNASLPSKKPRLLAKRKG